MYLPRKLHLAGLALSIIPIALGVAALATDIWLRIKAGGNVVATYGLLRCSDPTCVPDSEYPVAQGLLLAGVIAIAVGVILTLLLDIVTKNRLVHLLPGFFLFAGPTLIVIGLLLYAKHVFEDVSPGATTLTLGYSIILIIIAGLFGFLTAIYFAFAAGYRHRDHQVLRGPPRSPVAIYEQSERF